MIVRGFSDARYFSTTSFPLRRTSNSQFKTRFFCQTLRSFISTKNMNEYSLAPKDLKCRISSISNNYGYVIVDSLSKLVTAIDPGDSSAITSSLKEIYETNIIQYSTIFPQGLKLDYILCTHKHDDHIGGNLELKSKFPNLKVIGPTYEDIPGVDKMVDDGAEFNIGGMQVHVLHTPCHTKGHIVYIFKSQYDEGNDSPWLLFPGDTLFVGGCGRFFEGTAEDMLRNMDRLSGLPMNTAVFCAHEYTENNYRFLASLDQSLCSSRYEEVKSLRKSLEPTVPSTIGLELQTNLFMKCHNRDVQNIFNTINDPVQTMSNLRKCKNQFK